MCWDTSEWVAGSGYIEVRYLHGLNLPTLQSTVCTFNTPPLPHIIRVIGTYITLYTPPYSSGIKFFLLKASE